MRLERRCCSRSWYNMLFREGLGNARAAHWLRSEFFGIGWLMSITSFRVRVTAMLAAAFLRVWYATWRKDKRQLERLDLMVAGDRPVLAVFWHGQYIPLFAMAEGREATVIAGNSFRGQVIANICNAFGYRALLIPAKHDGQSFDFLQAALKQAKLGALALDGPLGPYHSIQDGTLRLASKLGMVIVPVSVASNPLITLARRWDKRELPLPFAKVAVAVGDPLTVPAELTHSDLTFWSNRLRAAMLESDNAAQEQLMSS
jgi:lysophospholipid acyltransferase (LPLAT)-like uncharacterized protein